MDMRKLDTQLRYVLESSPFYRNKFKGIMPTGLDGLDRLPYTTKSELLDDQEKNPPFGSNLCVRPSDIQRIHKTSGTTAKPLLIALTNRDIETTVTIGAKCFIISGLTKEDTVVHCLNYNMWAGGYTDHQSLERAGAAVIPFGVGHTKGLIETILLIRPSAIHCTPSYLKMIEAVLEKDFSLRPLDLHLRLGLFGGESGLQNSAFRHSIETHWGLKAMNANYGLSDVLSMFGAECRYQEGLHFMADGILYPEILDVRSNKCLPIEQGVVGELILSNMHKQAQPLIRYRTNDTLRVLAIENCPCGETGFRFEITGRSDDMIVVKGVNIFMTAIDRIISGYLDRLTGIYQVHVNRDDPIDHIRLVIELSENTSNHQPAAITLQDEFSTKLSVKPEVIYVKEGTLPRTAGKSKKLFRSL